MPQKDEGKTEEWERMPTEVLSFYSCHDHTKLEVHFL